MRGAKWDVRWDIFENIVDSNVISCYIICIMLVKVQKMRCKQCGYEWIPRKKEVRKCPNPKCQSVWFDKPKREHAGKSDNPCQEHREIPSEI